MMQTSAIPLATSLSECDPFLQQLAAISFIDWIAMFAGIAGVALSIKERIATWPLLILCSLAYIHISLRSGYFAYCVLNLVFIGISISGWYKWHTAKKSDVLGDGSLRVSRTTKQQLLIACAFVIVFTLLIGSLLAQLEGARLPYWDTFAMGTALVAQWMLSRKHIENWIFWIISDFVYLGMFLSDRLWPSVILFCVFIFLATQGWRQWKVNDQ